MKVRLRRHNRKVHDGFVGTDDMTKNDPGIVFAGMICLFLLKSA